MGKLPYHEFLAQVAQQVYQTPNAIRYGQALFNHLTKVRPDLAIKIVGTLLDPYFCNTSDEINPAFWAFIKEYWDADIPTATTN